MAEIVTILSTSWRLINAINAIVARIEQTRRDARALMFLEGEARSFLNIVNEGLVDVDTSPYLGTIVSLEGLLRDILMITGGYAKMSTVARLLNANKTRETILGLNRRLRLFVDTYLLQATTQAARVNLEALANAAPADQETLVGDDIQWEIMSQPTATTVHPRARINAWMQDVEQTELDDIPTDEVISTEPSRSPALVMPTAWQPQDQDPDIHQSRSAKCYHMWKNETCPIICRHTLCAPVRVPVCIADCVGRWICQAPQDHGCCTACIFQHCPLCVPETCMTAGPPGDMGIICADLVSKEWPCVPCTTCGCITDIVFSPLILLRICIPLALSGTDALMAKWHSMCCVTDT